MQSKAEQVWDPVQVAANRPALWGWLQLV